MKKAILVMAIILTTFIVSCKANEEPLTLKERAGTYKDRNEEMTIIINAYGQFTFKDDDNTSGPSDFFPTKSTELAFTVKINGAKHLVEFDNETEYDMTFTSGSVAFVAFKKYYLEFFNRDTY